MLLNYRSIGEGEPIFILHGLFGSADNWQTFAKDLIIFQSENHMVGSKLYLIDQRNHGRSSNSDEFSYELMANDLLRVMQEEGIESVTLLGHSMGGKTAMQFALMYPQRVRSLIVIDIAPKYYPPHHHNEIEGMSTLDLSVLKSRKEADEHMAKYIEGSCGKTVSSQEYLQRQQ